MAQSVGPTTTLPRPRRTVYPFLKRRIMVEAGRHQADVILIEDKGSGTSLLQDLQNDGLRPIGVQPKGDKVTRMAAQSAKIEAGQVLLPREVPWLTDFKSEILRFPHGTHDDQVDSVLQVLNWTPGRRRPPRIIQL